MPAGLRERIGELAGEKRRYGYRRIHVLLRREGWRVNRKRTYRIYRDAGLAVRRRKRKRIGFSQAAPITDAYPDTLFDLVEALTILSSEDAEAAEVAKLRIFAGLSIEDAAHARSLSRANAYRHWAYARAWLRDEPPSC